MPLLVHYMIGLPGETGEDILPPLPTGDIIKGSVTIDPDGYPLVYTGSRDNYFHIVALDRDQPTELWKLSAYDVHPAVWNDDWDGSSLVIGDYLFEGGENSWFYIVKLNRGFGPDGRVTAGNSCPLNDGAAAVLEPRLSMADTLSSC